ncbi:type II secretion system F family protein [Desulfovibrio aminophilus]|uniref:type II secretion system F family protein n=1 Tax=Desulfovibrio aminophilus TaxID=81425 RepID=UPI0033974ECF
MPSFTYKAITESGSRVTGTLEAESADAARLLVAEKGLIPSSVRRTRSGGGQVKAGGGWAARFTAVKPQDVILFTKQFRTMLSAGIAVVQTLEVLENQTENPRLRAALIDIAQDIRQGASLYRAFLKHSAVFTPLYCNMIRAGEISGTLIDVLGRLIYIVEHEFKVKKDIKSALTYPVIVLVALVIAFFVLVLFVFPNFISLFRNAGVSLPMPTRVMIGIHAILTHYWALVLPLVAGGFFGLAVWFRTTRGRLFRDTMLLRLPILGKVFAKAAMARFASIFAILQASGITVLESVEIISGTIGNAAIAAQFDTLREKLEQGRGLAEPLRSARYFTPMMITMIAIGEESGQLEEMLKEAAQHYDDEVEYSVSKMSELIGPVLVAGLTGVVGFFALAVFLPLVELMQKSMAGM